MYGSSTSYGWIGAIAARYFMMRFRMLTMDQKLLSSRLEVRWNSLCGVVFFFFFSSRRRHTRWNCDWSSDVCSCDLCFGGPVEWPADRNASGAAGDAALGQGMETGDGKMVSPLVHGLRYCLQLRLSRQLSRSRSHL